MKFYISYFYKLRFFTKNIIPLSTCHSDPAWFHQSQGLSHVYKDKNGVYCGLRAEPLVPGPLCEGACSGPERCAEKGHGSCDFLTSYNIQLHSLDFNDIIKRSEDLALRIQKKEGFEEEPVIVLLVYEVPSNPCSERVVLQKWFAENNIDLPEWEQS